MRDQLFVNVSLTLMFIGFTLVIWLGLNGALFERRDVSAYRAQTCMRLVGTTKYGSSSLLDYCVKPSGELVFVDFKSLER